MAAYNAPITVDIILKGERSIAKVIDQIEKVQGYIDKLTRKPIDLFSKKGGVGGDLAAKQRRVFQDLIRDIANAGTSIEGAAARSRILGNTLATTGEKAQLLSDALENVKIARGGITRQTAAVKNLAAAFNVAENEAKDYQARLNDIIRTSKGLQLQAVRDAEVERRQRAVRGRAPRTRLGGIEPGGGYKNLEANLKRIQERERQIRQARAKDTEKLRQLAALNKGIERSLAKMSEEGIKRLKLQSTLNQLKQIEAELTEKIAASARKERLENKKRFIAGARAQQARRKQFREDLALGVGFPLLTGAGAGGVLGGAAGALAGGGKGGFGLQILGSALGDLADRFIQSQSQLAASITETTDVFGSLEAAGFKVSGALKNIVKELEASGNAAAAYRIKQSELQKAYGANAVRDLSNFDRANQRVADSFKRINATLLPPLLRLFTAVADISATGLEGLAKLFEFLAGGTAKGGKARPGFRLEGQFAQAGAFERELANRPLVTREEQILGTFKRSKFFQQYKKDQEILRENQAIVDSINRRQKAAQQERIRKAAEARRIENEIKQIAVDKARIDLEILNKRLSIERQIRQAEIARANAQLRGAQAYAAAVALIAEQNVKNLELGRELFAPVGDETAINQIERAANAQKTLIETSVSDLSQALVEAGIYSKTVMQSIVFRYRDALQNSIDIRAEEQKRLFITKDAAYQKRTDLINAEVRVLTAATEEEANRLRLIQLQNEAREQAKQEGITDPALVEKRVLAVTARFAAQNKKVGDLEAFIKQATDDLNNLEATAVQVSQGIGSAFGTAMTTGVQELIAGTKTAQEVFVDFLKNIASTLLQAASQIIATYVAIGIARAFAGMGGSGNTSFGGNGVGQGQLLAPVSTGGNAYSLLSSFLNPGKTFAEGGFVDRPTNALIGEGSEPEYVIPESKMRESMARYSRGSRGASVIPETGAGDSAASGGGTAVAAPIDVRYTVERINSVDYVTADQFQRGMQSAATQGAKQGEQNTLKRLQMSGSTRKRLGL